MTGSADRPAGPDDWEGHWERFAESAAANPAQRMRRDLVLAVLARFAVPARFLDLGAGQGDLLAGMARRWPAASLVGLELSQGGADLIRRKVPAATVVACDLLAPSPALDAWKGWATHAACCEVLEHLDDPVAFLRAAARYLGPGAQLVVTVPGGPISAFDRHIGHRRHYTPASLARALGDAGFVVEETWRAGFPFFNLYRLAVIARGERLAADVTGGGGRLASAVMRLFGWLFHLNLPRSPFGWQVVGRARVA